MIRRTKIVVAAVLAVVMAMGLCACAPIQEDGLTALTLELPDGSTVDMMEKSSVTLPAENIGKEIKLSGTKVVNGEEITKELKTYELKEGYNDLTVYVTLADDAKEERTITVFVELKDAALKSSEPSKSPERDAQPSEE